MIISKKRFEAEMEKVRMEMRKERDMDEYRHEVWHRMDDLQKRIYDLECRVNMLEHPERKGKTMENRKYAAVDNRE